ncbi:MAG TPA: helix-turn-helix domain-containing protein [Anaerolineaceae bacterium]|jgi:AcrR family transcriptional regulator
MKELQIPESIEKQDLHKRMERAQRILDAAAALILRWGYNKTTIDDIARQAVVAKGTIYLHWKTREALFAALLTREKLLFAEDFKQRITLDPEGCTLHGIARQTVLAVMQRPLIKALFLRDQDILGKLAQSEISDSAYLERLAGFEASLEFMRAHGLARTDLSLQAQVHIWAAVSTGFFLASPLMPAKFSLPDDQLADLMAETIRRTLEPDQPVPPEEYQKVSQIFLQYVGRSTAAAAEQFQREIEVS